MTVKNTEFWQGTHVRFVIEEGEKSQGFVRILPNIETQLRNLAQTLDY